MCLPGSRSCRFHRTVLALLLAVLVLGGSDGASAQTFYTSPVIIILVPGLRADDLTSSAAGGLANLARQGAIGWMNCRTARVPGQREEPQEAAYVTLGAGSRATAGPYARTITSDSLARLRFENGRLDHDVQVGLLGDIIRDAGGRTKSIGNEDDTGPRNAGLWILADHTGHVTADLASATARDPHVPFGLKTDDMRRLAWKMMKKLGVGPLDVELWYFGDLARADRYAPFCTSGREFELRWLALSRLSYTIDQCVFQLPDPRDPLGSLVPPTPIKSTVILLAPSAADSAGQGDRLAPILMWGPGITPGLLTSGSTHTPGLVTNTDFLPTVASLLGLKTPIGMVGRPITSIPLPESTHFWDRLLGMLRIRSAPKQPLQTPTAEMWAKMHDDWYVTSRQQSAFGGLPTIQMLLVLASLGAVLLFSRWKCCAERLERFGASLALIPIWMPLVFLLLPVVAPRSLVGDGALLAVVFAAVAAVGYVRPGMTRSLAVVPLAAVSFLTVLDLMVGSPLMRQAWMSYSVMEGARYYGIGNEYCGAVLAAALGVVMLLPRLPLWLLIVGLAALATIVGWPSLGANAGGFLGLAAGFGVAMLVWIRGQLRLGDVVLLCVIIGICTAATVAWDAARSSGAQTHIARSLAGNPVQIALRKEALNIWLLFHSPWSLALVASATGLLLSWRRGDLRQSVLLDRRLAGALSGMLAGSLALLVLNDSGVIAAAESLMITWAVCVVGVSPRKQGENAPVLNQGAETFACGENDGSVQGTAPA